MEEKLVEEKTFYWKGKVKLYLKATKKLAESQLPLLVQLLIQYCDFS